MTFELVRETIKIIECLCLGIIGLIVIYSHQVHPPTHKAQTDLDMDRDMGESARGFASR